MADGMERLARALKGRGGRSVSEEEVLLGGSPIDELRRTVNTRRPTPERLAEGWGALGEEAAYMAPVAGETLSARDAWDASGRAARALEEGRYGDAAGDYVDMLTGTIGAVPVVGTLARASKRAGQWMDRNLHPAVNAMTDLMPRDPGSQTNIFAGPGAKTADHSALSKAQQMEATGATPDEIWQATGWGRGADGKWRFEIDDSKAAMYRQPDAPPGYEGEAYGTLDDLIHHPELFEAYPDLASVNFGIHPGLQSRGAVQYGNAAADDALWLNTQFSQTPTISLHELQHLIQRREGFGLGSTPSAIPAAKVNAFREQLEASPQGRQFLAETAKDLDGAMSVDDFLRDNIYRRYAGEAEARNVQAREHLGDTERLLAPPWITEDVPRKAQIVKLPGRSEQLTRAESRSPMRRYYGTETPWTGYRHDQYADEWEGTARRFLDDFENTPEFTQGLRAAANREGARPRVARPTGNVEDLDFDGQSVDWNSSDPGFMASRTYVIGAGGDLSKAIDRAEADLFTARSEEERQWIIDALSALGRWNYRR